MATLLLRLSAPLQSWGIDSLFDERGTNYYPSKSGIVGLVAAALGRTRDDSISDIVKLKFGVRIDNQGTIINDFQVTDMGEKLNGNVSNHKYLSDATFLVGLETEDVEFLNRIKEALDNPKFSLFLGRRSCPPTFPLNLGIRNLKLYDALYDEKWLLPQWRQNSILRANKIETLRIITDASESATIVNDVPISFSPLKREYGFRYIKEQKGKRLALQEKETTQDPMKELG